VSTKKTRLPARRGAAGSRRWVGLAISLGTLVGFLAVLEIGARVYVRLVPPLPQTHLEFRRTQPPPYRNAPYFSEAFLAESFAHPGGWSTPPGTRLILPHDWDGTFFHVRDGLRQTTGQPSSFVNTVWMFGGSTVFCSEVPDDLTLPSFLQRDLAARYGDRYRIVNAGTTTVAIVQEVERLRTVAIQPGDLVIFYDGVNDILQRVYYGRDFETIVEHNRRAIEELPLPRRLALAVVRRLSSHSRFAEIVLDPYDADRIPPHLLDAAQREPILARLRDQYRAEILAAREQATARGARFLHFLQPNLLTVEAPSAYERSLLRYTHLSPKGIDLAYRYGYPELREVAAELGRDGFSVDLSGLLNERQPGEEFYLDTCHVNHRGNEIIAAAIAREVVARESASWRIVPPDR